MRKELGTAMCGAIFATKSVGAVFGIELVSGEQVVLKLFHPTQTMMELAAMHRCLERLVNAGFPAPAPRSRLFETEDGILGGFYAFVDGTMGDGHEATVRRELACILASCANLLASESSEHLPLAPTRRQELWAPSHRSFLKLDETPESRWIDEIARRAQSVIGAANLPLMPAHLDWGVKNVRFGGEHICAVYDWDSLFAASEAEMVGRAAAQFTGQWEFPAPLTPSPAEAQAFVAEYETARGRRFSQEENQVIAAAAEYLVAQIARIELASGSPPAEGYLSLLGSFSIMSITSSK